MGGGDGSLASAIFPISLALLEGAGDNWTKGVIDYVLIGSSKLCLLFLVDALPNGFTLGRIHDYPPLSTNPNFYIIPPSILRTANSKPYTPLVNTKILK